VAKVFAIVAYLLGLAGAAVYFAYIVGAGTGLWPRDESIASSTAYLTNSGLLLLFALQHSAMQRRRFLLLPAHLERSAYVGASGIVLGALTLLWQPIPGALVWDGPLWIVGISMLAAAGIAWCSQFDHAAFFGLRPAWTGRVPERGPLFIDGPYRYVRHPLMLGLLIAVWAQPRMPPELLMLNAGMTLYVGVGIYFEERDLLRDYGADYEKYRGAVPAIVPWKWW
jgi:protein-S-isoprenylcysteine O-methyltransferase Ste14